MKLSRLRFGCFSGACVLSLMGMLLSTAAAAGEEVAALTAAIQSITTDSARHYVTTLADDTFEGRAAGSRGGRAAGLFIVKELERLKIRGAGENGSYYQRFGAGLSNVLGVLEGSDPELKRQYILIGAHYDHVGYGNARNSYGPTGYIHNGADDNASGVAGLLEVATAFSQLAEPPKRSVVFAFWDGEEAGLLGSKHWVDHPTIPLSSIAASMNIDMIGRLRGGRVEVYAVRSSKGFRRLVSEQNDGVGLLLDFNPEMKANSDHYSFLSHHVPTLFFHTGLHDDYHRPSDDADKINADGLRQTATLIFKTAYELAERSRPLVYREGSISESTSAIESLTSSLPAPPARLGITWDDRNVAEGLKLVRVQRGSPAESAGLRLGDRVVGAAGAPHRRRRRVSRYRDGGRQSAVAHCGTSRRRASAFAASHARRATASRGPRLAKRRRRAGKRDHQPSGGGFAGGARRPAGGRTHLSGQRRCRGGQR